MTDNVFDLTGAWEIEGFDFGEGQPHLAYKKDYCPSERILCQVPGIVQNALVEAKKVPDPYFEKNNEKLLWVEEKEWWFFKDFTIPKNINAKKFFLVFEGINYYANLWIDGIPIGHQEGMFRLTEYDISKLIKPGTQQRLTLRIRLLEKSIEDRPGGKLKRGVVWSSGVTAPFSYWWNWAPHLVPIGIWKPVYIKYNGGVKISDIQVVSYINWSDSNEPISADLTITYHLQSFVDDNIVVKGKLKGKNFEFRKTIFKEEMKIIQTDEKTKSVCINLKEPQLWWPNGIGKQNLYILEISIEDQYGHPIDLRKTQFGIREITLVANENDKWVQNVSTQSNRLWSVVGNPYPWTFIVNKRRIFIKGSNFLPTDSLFRFSKNRYELFLEQAKEASLNMLRVWGGGIYETEDFFNLCDEKGLLLWVDFWLSCADYPLLPHDIFLESAESMVKGIRNHPSVALWCGGNEYNPDAPENAELVTKLGEVCNKLDPTRPFRRGSPYKGDRHGGILKLPSRTSNKYNGDILDGDQRLVLFRSEVAVLRSSPVLESLKKFIDEKNIWPINKDIWEYHHAVILEQQRDVTEYKPITNDIQHWIMAGQITHSLNRQYNLEYCRQSKYMTSGILEWSLNGTWPSFHREMIDYYGVPKPVFYAYKRASRDIIITVDMEKYIYDAGENFNVPVYAVNDNDMRIGDVTAKIFVYNKDMQKVYFAQTDFILEKDISQLVFRTNWIIPEKYKKQVLFIYVELVKYDMKMADNFYWIGVSSYQRPEELLNLKGYWQVQVGKDIDEKLWKDTLLPSYWKKPQGPPPEGQKVFYKKVIVIPENWQGTKLELYSAGIEGNDIIRFNGTKIGQTEEEMSILLRPDELTYTEELEQKGKFAAVGVKSSNLSRTNSDDGTLKNVRISADPFTTPNLIKRFYMIPDNLINWGSENIVEIELYGDYATGISEEIFIRKRTPKKIKQEIIEYYNQSEYFADIGSLPKTVLDTNVLVNDLSIPKNRTITVQIQLQNKSDMLAFFVHIVLNDFENEGSLIFSDNYFYMLPGQKKDVLVTIKNNMNFIGSKEYQFELRGWNLQSTKIGKKFKIKFED